MGNLIRGKEIEISEGIVETIDNWGERVFAEACASKDNLLVLYQVPVGESIIDFKVYNKNLNGSSRGKLVEVTETLRKNVKKGSQKKRMEDSGLPYIILCGEDLAKIAKSNENGNDTSGRQ